MTRTLLYFISFHFILGLFYFCNCFNFIYLFRHLPYLFTYSYFRRKDLQTQTVSRAAQAHPSNDTDYLVRTKHFGDINRL